MYETLHKHKFDNGYSFRTQDDQAADVRDRDAICARQRNPTMKTCIH